MFRQRGKEMALQAVVHIEQRKIIPLEATLAY